MSHVDFAQLLSGKPEEIKRPSLKPAGIYHATIANYKLDTSSQKKTPYVRLEFTNVQPGSDFTEDDLKDSEGNRIDFSKWKPSTRNLSDYYFVPDENGKVGCWKLNDLFDGLGIQTGGRPYNELIAELRGMPVLLTVTIEPSQDGTNFFNHVARVAPDK